jgi:hypothetical protein
LVQRLEGRDALAEQRLVVVMHAPQAVDHAADRRSFGLVIGVFLQIRLD